MICFDLNMISNKAKADLALITAGFNTVEAADLWCEILSPLFTPAFWCHGNKAVLFLFFQKMLNQNRRLEEQKGFDCTTATDSASEFWLAGPAANLTLHQNNCKPHFPLFKDELNTCSDKLRQQLCLSQLWKELHKRLLKVAISVFQFYFTITELHNCSETQTSLTVSKTSLTQEFWLPLAQCQHFKSDFNIMNSFLRIVQIIVKWRRNTIFRQQLSDPAARFLSVCFWLDVYRMCQRLLSISQKSFYCF